LNFNDSKNKRDYGHTTSDEDSDTTDHDAVDIAGYVIKKSNFNVPLYENAAMRVGLHFK